MMQAISDELSRDNNQILIINQNKLILIYVLGFLGFTLLLVLVMLYISKNIFQRAPQLRKALLLMPYKRLSEDTNTMTMLKNLINISI